MIPNREQALSALLKRLFREGGVSAQAFVDASVQPAELGLVVERARVFAPADLEILDTDRIDEALSPDALAWLRDLRVYLAIDSTNLRMMEAAQTKPVAGRCWFAELQTAGRGRRGRRWHSPFARNLMVSFGIELGGWPRQAGALSLAVGLAVADLVEQLGVADVTLKWPNDVLIGGAKVCGILIELAAQRQPLECVVGVGLNLEVSRDLRNAVDQEITGLRECGVADERNLIAAGLISNVVRYAEEFKRRGFGVMRAAYDQVHICQDRRSRVVQGSATYDGTVVGVTDDGELRIRGRDGERRFNSGEVSLRMRTKPAQVVAPARRIL